MRYSKDSCNRRNDNHCFFRKFVIYCEVMDSNIENLLYDASKQAIVNCSTIVEGNNELLKEMLEISLSQIPKISCRATRVICELLIKDDSLAVPYFNRILQVLPEVKDESLVFNLLRIFVLSPLPEDEDDLGWLAKICFDWLDTNVQRIAIKAYALDILERLAGIYPEITPELTAIIKLQMPHLSPGFQSRGTKVLKNLKRYSKGSD
jgi:hypothetical protein